MIRVGIVGCGRIAGGFDTLPLTPGTAYTHAGAWRQLGVFPFGTTNHARVILSNDANGIVVGDAVKFVPE